MTYATGIHLKERRKLKKLNPSEKQKLPKLQT
jgi:hypothetical protein